MAEPRIDLLARAFARGLTRRRLVGLFGGGALATGGLLAFPRSALVCQRVAAICDDAHGCCTGATCRGARCVCDDGWESCDGGFCADLGADENHCGRCGNRCNGGETCCAGACVDTWGERANCGACGHACGEREMCVRGVCLACPLDSLPCGDVCCARDRCAGGQCRPA